MHIIAFLCKNSVRITEDFLGIFLGHSCSLWQEDLNLLKQNKKNAINACFEFIPFVFEHELQNVRLPVIPISLQHYYLVLWVAFCHPGGHGAPPILYLLNINKSTLMHHFLEHLIACWAMKRWVNEYFPWPFHRPLETVTGKSHLNNITPSFWVHSTDFTWTGSVLHMRASQ